MQIISESDASSLFEGAESYETDSLGSIKIKIADDDVFRRPVLVAITDYLDQNIKLYPDYPCDESLLDAIK